MRPEILETPSSGSTAQNTIGNRWLEVTDIGKTGGKWSLNVRLRRIQLRPASPRPLPVTDRGPQPSITAVVLSHPADPEPPVDGEKMQSTGASGNVRRPCIQTD
ncbi:unnamed protein product [Leuciscus chuanchicus]